MEMGITDHGVRQVVPVTPDMVVLADRIPEETAELVRQMRTVAEAAEQLETTHTAEQADILAVPVVAVNTGMEPAREER